MSDVLNGCQEQVTTMVAAKKPVITPLLPIKGLRHEENGDLTADAIKTITDGLTSLGINVNDEDAQNAIMTEMKQTLCNLNGQYQFLLKELTTTIAAGETVPQDLLNLVQEKNMAMRDIISVSRQILVDSSSNTDDSKLTEGWLNVPSNNNVRGAIIERFQTLQAELLKQAKLLGEKNYTGIQREGFTSKQGLTDQQRTFELSEEKMKSVSANLALYSFLNVIAIGLLFYIVSSK